MADNTTTYTAVIDAQVKGGEDIEKLGEDAEKTGGEFVKLQLKIRQTQKDLQAAAAAGDKAKFNKLRADLDELEESLEKVQFQAKQFDDQLASLPGPAGAAGNAIKSVDGAFKVLIANPIIAVIAAIAGAFLLMKKALSSTAEGQETLNRVQSAFSKILGPILALVEKVALPIFEGFAKVLEFVAAGFSKLVSALGISEGKIKEATFNIDKVQQDAAEKEKKRQEDATKTADDAAKKREDNARKAAEAKQKREEAEKKKEEERLKNLADANKVLTEAYIATLTERDQEIYKAGEAQNERLLALEKAGIKDKTSVLEQGRLEVAAINKKYDDEEAKKVEEKKKKDEEDAKKKVEDDKAAADKTREDNILGLETQLEFDFLSGEQRKALITQKEEELLKNKELTENQRTAIQKAATVERGLIDQAELEAKKEIQLAQLDLVAGFGSLLTQIAGKNKALAIAGIVIEQGAAIGKILVGASSSISGQIAAANAQAALFPPAAPLIFANLARGLTMTKISAGIGIAGAIAGAAKGISAINQSGVPGGGGGGGASSAGSISIPAPTVQSAGAPQIQGTQAASPGSQIAATLASTTGKPIRAYVVGQDISSQQALDRRTNVAATFGG